MSKQAILRVGLFGLALCGLGAALPVTCFGPERRLDPPGADSATSFNFKRGIATQEDGSVHAAWHSDLGDGPVVLYRRSLDGGTTWSAPTPLSEPDAHGEHPAIAASAGRVFVGWHERRDGGQHVVVRGSDDGGASFGPPRRLSSSGAAAHASLDAQGEHAHVVWMDEGSGSPEVHVTSSRDGGATWLPERPLSPPRHASWVPSVSAWGEVAVVAWVDYRDANEEGYVRVSRDGGASWGDPIRVTFDPADSWAPSVVVRGQTIFLAFFDRRVAGLLDGDVEAALDAAARRVGLSLPPAPPRDPDVYYLPEFRARIAAKREAILAAAPGWVAAGGSAAELEELLLEFESRMQAWADGWGIFLTRSPDLGRSWEPARLVSAPGGPALRPSLALDEGRLHLAWFDGRHGPFEIYSRTSLDAGTHFGPEQRLTRSPRDSMRPSLAAGGAAVHVLWMESDERANEIRYTRGSVLGATPRR